MYLKMLSLVKYIKSLQLYYTQTNTEHYNNKIIIKLNHIDWN